MTLLSNGQRDLFNGAINIKSDTEQQALYWLRFIRDPQWSRREKHELLTRFSCPSIIYQLSECERQNQLPNVVVKPLSDVLEMQIQQDLQWMKKEGGELITFNSPCYPEQLSQTVDPPLALFCLGDISLLAEPQVAIVGSRRPTPIGAKVAKELANDLSRSGLTITSGMALGVDGLSHQGALDNAGSTIAVLGCGLDVVYPARHRGMYINIKQHGLLVSEYPPRTRPAKYTFPERNRIVSGLSLGVIIIEAAFKSGTLITARLAIEQNKEVMVLPGSALSQQYEGSHCLLRDGATLVSCAADVLYAISHALDEYVVVGVEPKTNGKEDQKQRSPLDENEALILGLIGAQSTSMDEIIVQSQLTAAQVSSMLLKLELYGRVGLAGDGGYVNLS